MEAKLKTHKLGKLRIYLKTGEKIKSETLLRKVFPKSTYTALIAEARKDGIMNAHAFHTHTGFENNGQIHRYNIEGENDGLTICIELIDQREKLETFFKKHIKMLKDKTVIYKEVEFWDNE
jgi:PII-like signaling protein